MFSGSNPKIKDFIAKILPDAQAIERETGIPWHFAMTQAAHESGYGQSRLTKEANNLFGITGDSWKTQGKPVYEIVTTEYDKDKQPYSVVRPFRYYASWEDSLRDWASLVVRRYPKALEAAKAKDFPAFAKALQEGGYATDPKYASKLDALNKRLEGLA